MSPVSSRLDQAITTIAVINATQLFPSIVLKKKTIEADSEIVLKYSLTP